MNLINTFAMHLLMIQLLCAENQFRGIDKDEVEFLDLVADKTAQLEKQKNEEIKKELEEFRISFLCLQVV